MPSPDGDAPNTDAVDRARRALRDVLVPGQEETSEETGRQLGDYELVEVIGKGATGIVYRARHAGIHRTVALKLMRDADLATDSELRRFWAGAAAAAELEHPNIVPVYHVSDNARRPFFTMRLVEGQTLAHAMADGRPCPARSAALVAKVARAVQYAHEHGVLHRDLKPANILIDLQGEPHVADFGLAKRLDVRSSVSQSEGFVGTVPYMSPEQASGDSGKLTFAADIYSLGVILYELLTGELPFSAPSLSDLLRQITSPFPPPSPRKLEPRVSRDLALVCMKALEKDPAERYRSAETFAADLESVVHGGSPLRQGVMAHALGWIRRYPLRAAAACSGALLAAALALTASSVWQAQQSEQRSALAANAYSAVAQAGAVLAQLREYADRVEQAALDPAWVPLLVEKAPDDHVVPQLREYSHEFDGMFLLGADGYVRAQWPPPEQDIYGKSYAFRDYFRGAKLRVTQVGHKRAYLSRAFRSEGDGHFKFAISTPVFDRGEWVGLLIGMINANSAFGAVRLEEEGSGRICALLGPRDNERDAAPDAPLPDGFSFLIHPALTNGAEHKLSAPSPAKLREVFHINANPARQFAFHEVTPWKVADYRDPVTASPDPWLAAFAPVGDTEYLVLVQTLKDAPSPFGRLLASQLAVWVAPPSVLSLLLIGGAAVLVRRRQRAQAWPAPARGARHPA